MISTVTHVLPLTKIRRRRVLPMPGTVLVRAGQPVNALDVIAEANLSPEHIAIDIARGLGVSRGSAGRFIKRSAGDAVTADSVLAEKGGFGRVIRAPKAGKVVAISGGQMLLEISNKPFQLKAGLSGNVVEIEVDYGAIIESTGAWVQGIWGNSKLAIGGLRVLAQEPDHVLTIDESDPSQRGAVIYAGHCSSRSALDSGVTNQWRGLILGSMMTQLVPLASKMPYPIMVLEGFGKIPINAAVHKLLSTSNQRETVINSMAYNRMSGERPEIIIPVEGSGSPSIPIDLQRLEEGSLVRLLRQPHMGEVGELSLLLPGLTRFPSGLRAPGAQISFENGEKVLVPLANIEVLG
jgi:hypothetical protein